MEDKINRILELSEKTHKEVSTDESVFSKLIHIFEKLIIPIMLAILAYVTNSASIRISQAQLELAESQLSLAQAEATRNDNKHRDELRAKYISLFVNHINSSDERKQKIALSVIDSIDNGLAQEMANIIEVNKTVSKSVAEKIQMIRHTARATAVAMATGKSGNWRRYEACVSIPDNAVMDKKSAKSRVIGGVGAGTWGNWEGDFRFINQNQVCRTFAHQIHDQNRLLEITVEYDLPKS